MKRNVLCKKLIRLSLMCLFFIAMPQRSAAQMDAEAADYQGGGMALSDVTTAKLSNGIPDITDKNATRVLLYNVGKDMFLNAGGYWGTRTATFTVGLPLILSKPDSSQDYYYIRGPFYNERGSGTGSCMAFVNDTELTKRGVFYDRDVTNSINNSQFYFEKVTSATNDNVYRIYIMMKGTAYYLCAGCPMVVKVFEQGNKNLVRALTEEEREELNIAEDHTYWKLVSDENMEEQFTEDYQGKTLADASFLMRAQGFNISNIYNTYKDNYGKGWRTEGTVDYATDFNTAFAYVSGGKDLHGTLAPNFGMFQCAGLRNGKEGDKLYQTVTVKKTGWYMIECQGFYNDANGQVPYANLYAKFLSNNGQEPPQNSAAWTTTPLLGKSYGETPDRLGKVKFNAKTFQDISYNGDAFLANDIADGKVSNKVEAGVLFYAKLYPNSVMIYANIPSGERTMEIGIELTKDMVSRNTANADAPENDYIYVDDFRMKYLGESFALSEAWTDFKQPEGKESDYELEYKNKALILNRTFTIGKWNTICLPVDLMKWQLQDAFSMNVKLAKLVECAHEPEHPGRIEFQTVNLDKLADDDIVIRSGECYIINPDYGSVITNTDIEVGDVNLTHIKTPYYIIPKVSLSKKALVENVLNLTATGGFHGFHAYEYENGTYTNNKSYSLKGTEFADCQLDIYATFEGGQTAPANSYIFYGGNIYHLNSAFSVPGYSWWIVDADQGTTPAKRHTLSFGMDGISDTTTVIEGITADTTGLGAAAVYNLWGQAVRRGTTDLSGLPSGIYVVNGKKIAVK